jgi:MYXO-CTERM domain-containing protein
MTHDMKVRPIAIVAAGLALLLAGPVEAQVELSNDGYVDGGIAAFQAGFVAGELAASRFVPPAPTQLLRIRFLFGGGTTTDVQTVTVHVWDDAAGTDEPGAELYVNDFAVGPSDEAFQEVDPTDGGAIDVTGPFRVGLEFHHDGTPSVARDDDGLDYPDRNFINASGFGWTQSNTLGMAGDWIIRAVVAEPIAGDADADGDGDADADGDAAADGDGDGDGDGDADSGACTNNTQCPEGQHCDPSGFCTFDCRTDRDCPAATGTCNSLGQCITGSSDGGCGCRLAERPGPGGPLLLGLILGLAVLRRHSQRTSV